MDESPSVGKHVHLFDFGTRDIHLVDHVWKESDHLVVVHGHVGDYLFERGLLGREVLVLAATRLEFGSQLRYLSLWSHHVLALFR